MQSDDEPVAIKITKSRLQHYVDTPEYQLLTTFGTINLRMVKIHLSNNTTEYLVTNLTANEFTTEDIGYIYHQRWGIAT